MVQNKSRTDYNTVTLVIVILDQLGLHVVVCCLFGIASPEVGLPRPSDFVNRSLTPGMDQWIP